MNILCFGPHPDDLEFGVGGTLCKYVDAGHNVYLMIMTSGELGGDSELRIREQEESARIIGAKEVIWGGYRDTQLVTDSQSIRLVEEKIRRIQPMFIFAPYNADTHQDHRNLSSIVLSAARNHRNILFYETPTTTPHFQPNVFVDIGSVLDRKMKALLAHNSQVMKTNITDLPIVEMAASTATFRGLQCRVKSAEGFMSVRYFLECL